MLLLGIWMAKLLSSLQDYLAHIIDQCELLIGPEQVCALFGNIEDIYEFNRWGIPCWLTLRPEEPLTGTQWSFFIDLSKACWYLHHSGLTTTTQPTQHNVFRWLTLPLLFWTKGCSKVQCWDPFYSRFIQTISRTVIQSTYMTLNESMLRDWPSFLRLFRLDSLLVCFPVKTKQLLWLVFLTTLVWPIPWLTEFRKRAFSFE